MIRLDLNECGSFRVCLYHTHCGLPDVRVETWVSLIYSLKSEGVQGKNWEPVLRKNSHCRLHTHTEHLWSRRKPGRGRKIKTDPGSTRRPSQARIKEDRTGLTWLTVNPWIFSPTWYCSALSQAFVLFHLHAPGWALLQLKKVIKVRRFAGKLTHRVQPHNENTVIWLR